MANTSTRTLRLLSLLQSHRFWPGGELAERLGVSQRTLRRDVDRLRELGYPVEARRGVDGENGVEVAARMLDVLTELAASAPEDSTVVAATHGVAARVGVGALVGLEPASWRALGGMANCSWAVVERFAPLPHGPSASRMPGADSYGTPGAVWRIVEWNAGSLPEPLLSDDTLATDDDPKA